VVVTSDPFLRDSAAVMGLDVMYLGRERGPLQIERFFERDIMSVHLNEGAPPQAKAGRRSA
jgi:ATPase